MIVRNSPAPLGAEIRGLDLSALPDSETLGTIESVVHDRGVVVFRGQQLTEEQHIAFSRCFGTLEIHVAQPYLKPGHPEILVLSNVVENGRHIGVPEGGQYWHSDLSYVVNPSRCSLLYAVEIPMQDGRALGETLFASAAHAYDTLSGSLKIRLETARAVHSYADRYRRLQKTNGREPLGDGELEKVPAVCHPVIRAHPLTARKVLFVNEGFTVCVEGMPKTDSEVLLQGLFAHITRSEGLYAHQWQQGDLLMWDNCLVQHRAVGDYALPLRRLMYRTTVAGSERTP